jgi:hypothetical protein
VKLHRVMTPTLLQLACTTCNEDVQDGIFDERFFLVLVGLTAPFAIAWVLTWVVGRRLG